MRGVRCLARTSDASDTALRNCPELEPWYSWEVDECEDPCELERWDGGRDTGTGRDTVPEGGLLIQDQEIPGPGGRICSHLTYLVG